MEGVGWIMSKEHEIYVKKVKRDKLKVTLFRIASNSKSEIKISPISSKYMSLIRLIRSSSSFIFIIYI